MWTVAMLTSCAGGGAGYVYLLTHPGTPCVFWDHLQESQLRPVLRRLISIRQQAGIHCRSSLAILKCATAQNPPHLFVGSRTRCMSFVYPLRSRFKALNPGTCKLMMSPEET